ncbi:hypothetical protein KFK14_06810 [Sphingobium phenoxybenzoativorans]|uniref:Uncharacterized protein n=1 Tax=Sphingobium phenoxybenzoativorans TaxID=1592790 RepID=A0A975K976_9SPHN|nr:hypothetical protein [Sphingobium phenoxybenzoativorans]QUT07125.1 hypothetical protein KFK14_06810 [Sphingobium phenoxybenzoativorans]
MLTPSPFVQCFGPFDASVEREVLSGVEGWGCWRRMTWWRSSLPCGAGKRTGHGAAHMLADDHSMRLLEWREYDRQWLRGALNSRINFLLDLSE